MSLTREQFHQHIKHLVDRTDLHVTSAFALEDHDAEQRVEIERLTHQLQQKALLEQSVGLDAAWKEIVRLHEDNMKLQADLEACREALAVYAADVNWHRKIRVLGDPDWVWCGSPIHQYPNTWAKAALKESP